MMEISVNKMVHGEISEVVRLHIEGLPSTINSFFGKKHLGHLYRTIIEDEKSCVYIAKVNGVIGGVVSVSSNIYKLKKRVMDTFSIAYKFSLMIKLLFRPTLLLPFIVEQMTSSPIIHKDETITGCLTTIIVKSEFQGKGIAKQLMQNAEEFFRANEKKYFFLETEESNSRSRNFYKKESFTEVKKQGASIILVKELS